MLTQFGFLRRPCFAALLAAIAALPSSGTAASFDCTNAASPREQLVCLNQTLSDLDSQLGLKYRERRSALSATGAELLQRSQKSWLKYLSSVCPIDLPKAASYRESPEDCLKDEYLTRLKQLDDVGARHGPFTFTRVDVFSVKPSPDASDRFGTKPGLLVGHVAYPQIDNVSSPVIQALNKLLVKNISNGYTSDCERGGDGDIGYRIGFANNNIVSIAWTNSTYCHGAAHGFGGTKTDNIVLLPVPRKLNSTDLFGSGKSWIPKLQALFWEGLQMQGWTPPPVLDDDETGKRELKKSLLTIVITPTRWQFTESGIQVRFGPYEGGCYACTPEPVTVSWDSLKPLLVQGAPAP